MPARKKVSLKFTESPISSPASPSPSPSPPKAKARSKSRTKASPRPSPVHKRRVLTKCGRDVNRAARKAKADGKFPYTTKFMDKYKAAHNGASPSERSYRLAKWKSLSRKGSGSPCEGKSPRSEVSTKAPRPAGPWILFVQAARKEFERVHKEKPKPTGLTQAIKAMKVWTPASDGKPGKGDMAKLKQHIPTAKFKKLAMS